MPANSHRPSQTHTTTRQRAMEQGAVQIKAELPTPTRPKAIGFTVLIFLLEINLRFYSHEFPETFRFHTIIISQCSPQAEPLFEI